MLYALYSSNDNSFFDAENVLLYNLDGTKEIARHSKNGLCFERQFDIYVSPMAEGLPHYSTYSAVNTFRDVKTWEKDLTLATWENIRCPNLHGNLLPLPFWYAAKTGIVKIENRIEDIGYYGMTISIKSPKGCHCNIASQIKPLLDGVICAFHYAPNFADSHVLNFLSEKLADTPSQIQEMFRDKEIQVLGERNIAHKFGNGIQWDPADDYCLSTEIFFSDCLNSEDWLMANLQSKCNPCEEEEG